MLTDGHAAKPLCRHRTLGKKEYDKTTNWAWAHWNASTNEAHPGKPISYSELVKRTGIEFLPGVSPVEAPTTMVVPEIRAQSSPRNGSGHTTEREEDLGQMLRSSVQSAVHKIQKSIAQCSALPGAGGAGAAFC